MKKLLAIALAIMIIICMTVPAYAATPLYKPPAIPDVNIVTEDIHVELPDSFWDKWFAEHPIKIDWSKLNFTWFK